MSNQVQRLNVQTQCSDLRVSHAKSRPATRETQADGNGIRRKWIRFVRESVITSPAPIRLTLIRLGERLKR
ncbi:hypothetical protein EVAR_43972_1 [Eumeta japonica]|uniref:Uncharacterized protein n=1 Tax=Eumeta variegata TaxID=151549 RepID=A0A4C1XZI5_EUMVA|nr:hypothetical protein EVAR_43972_1 [Eumeta japonica]